MSDYVSLKKIHNLNAEIYVIMKITIYIQVYCSVLLNCVLCLHHEPTEGFLCCIKRSTLSENLLRNRSEFVIAHNSVSQIQGPVKDFYVPC